ncbi:hypothetical protein CGH50_06195, partial [Vibrio parahaemolyticus]
MCWTSSYNLLIPTLASLLCCTDLISLRTSRFFSRAFFIRTSKFGFKAIHQFNPPAVFTGALSTRN